MMEHSELINLLCSQKLRFGNRAHLKKLDNKTVKYLDTPSVRKYKVKYLGVHFDKKTQWKYQIKNISQKVNLKLGKIKSIASFLTTHTKNCLLMHWSFSFSIIAPRLCVPLHLFD